MRPCVLNAYAINAYGGAECINPHSFDLGISCEWSVSRPGRFTSAETAPGTHWVGLRAGMDPVEKRRLLNLPGLVLRPLVLPVCSQSLYLLRYPGSFRFHALVRIPVFGREPHEILDDG
jgi:hypothetical protein